jgi:alanyl-tRNA synthetase
LNSTTTERLFWADPYLQRFDATVTAVEADGVVLDRTAFYANSGGQVGDTGTLNDAPVIDTRYGSDGELVHLVQGDASRFAVGMRVTGQIDWDRRYRIMRHHSAQHGVFLAFKAVQGADLAAVKGGDVSADKARVDWGYFEDVHVERIEALLGDLIRANLAIRLYPSEDDPTYRYFELDGFEPIPCGGTHVGSTSEIGPVTIKRKSMGKQGVRLYVTCTT